MHTSIELDMYRIACYTLFPCCMAKSLEKAEGIHLRFKFIVEHGLECRHLRIHDHDICCDACPSEFHSLVGNGNGKVIDTMIL